MSAPSKIVMRGRFAPSDARGRIYPLDYALSRFQPSDETDRAVRPYTLIAIDARNEPDGKRNDLDPIWRYLITFGGLA